MDNTPKTESIVRFIEGIEANNIVLPEFQRNFVWDVGKTHDLLDSLVKDIFIGSIIYGIPSFAITVREIDRRPRRGKGSRAKLKLNSYSKDEIETKAQVDNFRLVLDGQQRITSLYRALKGIDEVWFVCKKPEDLDYGGDLDRFALEDLLYEFSSHQSRERLSVKVSDVYKTIEQTIRESKIKAQFFEGLAYLAEKTEDERDGEFDRYLTLLGKLQDFFKADKLLSYYLLNTTSEKFALFFERSNSKGIQLNFIDILAAKLYVGFNLRHKIDEFEDEHPDYTLNRETVVRTIAFFVGGGNVDRSYILQNLTHEHFNAHWDMTCDLYKRTLDFLYKNHFILSQRWMPYPNMMIPLMVFLRNIGGDYANMSEGQFRFLKFWYWSSIFSERYSTASNEVVSRDARTLQRFAGGENILDKGYLADLRINLNSPEEILSLTSKSSAVYKGILNLVNYHAGGLVDWRNTRRLSFNEELHDHHIFPQKYIKDTFGDDEEVLGLIDSVVNRTLIPKLTNIKIGKKPPSAYLQQLQANNPSLPDSLRSHLLKPELIGGALDGEYSAFLDERAEAMFGLVKEHVLDQGEALLAGREEVAA